MSNQVRYEDLFDKDLFEKLKKNIDEVTKELVGLEKQFLDSVKETIKGLNDTDKSLKNIIATTTKAVNAAKNAVAVSNERKRLESELAKQLERLRAIDEKVAEQVQALIKTEQDYFKSLQIVKNAIKDVSKEKQKESKIVLDRLNLSKAIEIAKNKEASSYHELTEALGILRSIYQDVAAGNKSLIENTGITERELRKLTASLDKHVKKIDESVGLFQRNVGAYKDKIVESFVAIGGTITERLTEGTEASEKFKSVFVAAMQSAMLAAENGIGIFNRLGLAIRAFTRTALVVGAITLAFEGLMYVVDRLFPKLKSASDVLKELEINFYNNIRLINQMIVLQERLATAQKRLVELENKETLPALKERSDLYRYIAKQQRELLGIEYDYLKQQEQALEAELKRGGNAERIAEIEKSLLDIRKRMIDLSVQMAEQTQKLNSANEEYLRALQQIKEESLDIIRSSKILVDEVDRIGGSYKDAVYEITRRTKELLEKAGGDTEAIRYIYAAQAEAIKKATFDAKQSAKDFVQTIKEIAIDVFASNALYEEYVLRLQRTQDKIEEIQSRIAQLSKLRRLEFVKNDKELLRNINDTIQRLQDARDVLVDSLRSGADYTEKIRERIRNIYATFADEEEQLVNKFTEQKQQVIRELADTYTQIKTFLESALSRSVDPVIRKDLEDTLSEIGNAITEIQRLYEQKLAQELANFRKEQYKKELQDAEQRLQLLYEVDRTIAATEYNALLRKETNEEKKLKLTEEYRRKELELEKSYLEQQIALVSKYDDIQSQIRLQNLKRRLEEVTTELANQTKKVAEEATKQIVNTVSEAATAVTEIMNALMERSMNLQLRALERYSQQLQNRANILIALAEQGAVGVEQSLAEIEKRQQELQRAGDEIRRKAQQREAYLAALKTYASALDKTRDPSRALLETLKNVTLIRSFISSLPTFYEGTEYVSSNHGTKLKGFTKDNILARIHVGERIVPANLNRKLAGISNEDLVKLALKGKDETKISFDYDSLLNALAITIEEKGKKTTIKRSI